MLQVGGGLGEGREEPRWTPTPNGGGPLETPDGPAWFQPIPAVPDAWLEVRPEASGKREAVEQSARKDAVKVVGLGLPNDNKKYVHDGVTSAVILWNTMDLGYLTIYASQELANGVLKPGDKTMTAGKLGTLQIRGDNILLGKPFAFTKDNIDNFDF